MPNYSLQINSKFRPFSFQERLAPWQLYGQAYKELAESYNTLGVQAGDIASMLNRELDKEAYEQYQGYMQGLKENADALASNGLSPTLKNNIYNMSNRYSQEIRPIQRAAERRQLLAEEQRKLGDSMIFDFDAATTGLDKFMNNPTLNYRGINRENLLRRSQAQFGQFAKELRSFQKDPSMYSDEFHNTLVSQYGFTPEEATQLTAEIASGNITSNDAVARVANNLYNSTRVGEWNSPSASDAVWATIAEGAVAGIGQMTPEIIKDEKKLADYKYAKDLAGYRAKLQAKYDFDKSHSTSPNVPPIFRLGSGYINLTKDQAALKNNVDTYMAALNYFKKNPEKFSEYKKMWDNPKDRASLVRAHAGGAGISKENEAMTQFFNLMNLSKTLNNTWKNTPDNTAEPEFNFSVTQDTLGNKKFDYDVSSMNDMLQDLGTMYKPMFYNVSKQGMQNMMRGIQANVMASKDDKDDSKVGLISTLDDKAVKRKDLTGLNWDNAETFIVGDQEYVYFKDKADKGKIYKLKPGATGDFGEGAVHKNISNLYNNRNFEDYFISATDYMADVFGLYNMQHKGQTGTTKEISDIPSVGSYDDELFDYDYIYGDED